MLELPTIDQKKLSNETAMKLSNKYRKFRIDLSEK